MILWNLVKGDSREVKRGLGNDKVCGDTFYGNKECGHSYGLIYGSSPQRLNFPTAETS